MGKQSHTMITVMVHIVQELLVEIQELEWPLELPLFAVKLVVAPEVAPNHH